MNLWVPFSYREAHSGSVLKYILCSVYPLKVKEHHVNCETVPNNWHGDLVLANTILCIQNGYFSIGLYALVSNESHCEFLSTPNLSQTLLSVFNINLEYIMYFI